MLVNCAGFGKGGDFLPSNRESQTAMVDVNCRALTALSRLCLPYMPEGGLVLNIASIAAFAPTPRMAVYCATKAFVLAFSRALREELRPRGISVCAVCPGPMDTGLLARGGRPPGQVPPDRQTPPGRTPARWRRAPCEPPPGEKPSHTHSFFYKLYHLLAKALPHRLLVKIHRRLKPPQRERASGELPRTPFFTLRPQARDHFFFFPEAWASLRAFSASSLTPMPLRRAPICS